jgi:hypothetical protein
VRVRISWPNDELTAELADTPNTAVLKDVLPVEGTAKTWGEEVYFSIPVSVDLEGAPARLSTPARCASGSTAGPRPAVRPDTDLAGQRVPAGQRVQHPRHHRRRSATAWSRSRAATRSGSSMQTEPPPRHGGSVRYWYPSAYCCRRRRPMCVTCLDRRRADANGPCGNRPCSSRRLVARTGSQRAPQRLHAIITNIDAVRMSAAEVEAHHRLRGGVPEDTIRSLKNDFGMNHAPVQPFFGNWLYWQAVALAHNVSLWLRTLALPADYRRVRGKRLRVGFLNVPARLVRHGRRLHLRFGAAYRHLQAFVTALNRLRALPALADQPRQRFTSLLRLTPLMRHAQKRRTSTDETTKSCPRPPSQRVLRPPRQPPPAERPRFHISTRPLARHGSKISTSSGRLKDQGLSSLRVTRAASPA